MISIQCMEEVAFLWVRNSKNSPSIPFWTERIPIISENHQFSSRQGSLSSISLGTCLVPGILIITFSEKGTVDTIYSPVEVMNANGFHKFTAGSVKEHLLIDLRYTSFLLELSLLPKNASQRHKTQGEEYATCGIYPFFKEQYSTEKRK